MTINADGSHAVQPHSANAHTAPASPVGPGTASPANSPIATQPSSICQCRGSIAALHARDRPSDSAALSNGIRSRNMWLDVGKPCRSKSVGFERLPASR